MSFSRIITRVLSCDNRNSIPGSTLKDKSNVNMPAVFSYALWAVNSDAAKFSSSQLALADLYSGHKMFDCVCVSVCLTCIVCGDLIV